MSQSTELKAAETAPKTIYLKDYQAPNYLIDEIDLKIDLYEEHALVTSHMRVRHNRHTPNLSRNLLLNGEELELLSIKLDQHELPKARYHLVKDSLTITDVPDACEIEIVTKVYPQKNTALSGLYRSANTFCTQCEAEGFRRITYFMDHPDILTRYTTTVTADKTRFPILLSNGNLHSQGDLEKNRHFAKWEDPFKKPCYLFALVAGDFDLIEDIFMTMSGRQIALRIYVDKGFADQAHHAMYSVKQAMRWDEEAYGREYDLDIYMIVAIGDFNMGAMENKGLNIFNTKYVLAKPETATDDDFIHVSSVVAHEYFHNWTGNRVTCRDWFQLSLKEGLTIFRDQSFSEDMLSKAVMRIRDVIDLRETQFPEDAGPLAHPVRPDSYIEINNFYTATVYNKGAEILRMMQTILGKTLFRRAMDLYFARHDGQAVTIDDYVQIMEDVSGVDLTQFKIWYSQAGTPQVTVNDHYDEKSKTYSLTFTQLTPPTPGQSTKVPLHIPVRVGLLDKNGKSIMLNVDGMTPSEELVLPFTKESQTFEFKNVTHKPVASLMRQFSAPVKLLFNYSDDDLVFLSKHDVDAFNRWEACQQYALRVAKQLVEDHKAPRQLTLPNKFIDMYCHLLKENHEDHFLIAEMLIVPSEKMIGEQMNIVDVDGIHIAREFMLKEIARQCESEFKHLYNKLNDQCPYQYDAKSIGMRQLKNKALSYLAMLTPHTDIAMQQFSLSLKSNMTDTVAALTALANSDSPKGRDALDQFYQCWKNDPLIVDKWFAIQGASKLPTALHDVKNLMKHEAFDIKNPNKVYALIGSFGHRNNINFHVKTGEGYQFLREVVLQLDKLNPQVAARMMKPLTNWKRYDKERQALMKSQLKAILEDNRLSPDLYELVTKSLS